MGGRRKLWVYIVLLVAGIVLAGLSLWVYLLERDNMSLMRTGLGILFIVVAVVNIRRERRAAG